MRTPALTHESKSRCSTLLITSELQIKSPVNFHLISRRMANFQHVTLPHVGEDVEQRGLSFTADGRVH